ncbi:MAG: tetratricopeptide repeat protein [Deltaproteobacteria bacterium]|nr:tetratricopeptide repeat protein [Deltaproteobacteria bacterium]
MFETNRTPIAGQMRSLALLVLAIFAFSGCGGDIDGRLAEVRALQDVGQHEASIDELRQILAIVPDHPEATYRLGVALVQTGEPSRAVWALEKATEFREYAISASLLLASAHFAQRNFEAAIRASDRAIELDPQQHVALRLRARANVGAGRLEEALVDAERLLEAYPDDYGVYVILATVLGDLKRMDEAEVAHDKLKEIALEGGDSSIAHRGCLAPALFQRDQRRDMERASELFDECTELFPTNAFVIGEAMRFYDNTNQPEKATKLIRRAVEEASDNLSLRSQLASRLRIRGDVAGAEQILIDAAESFESAGAWNLLANFYRLEKRADDALRALDNVLELSGGGNDALHFTRADILIDLGEYDRAAEIAANIEERTYTKLLKGRIALEQGDAKEALHLFEDGVRAWPSNAGARFLAGRAALELGDVDRAISELREAMRADNQSTPAAALLAQVLYERGEYAEALRVAKIAQRQRDMDPRNVMVVVARSFARLGQYDDARSMLEALRQRPDTRLLAHVELAGLELEAEGPKAAIASIETSGLDLAAAENAELLRTWVDAMLAAGRGAAALARMESILARQPELASNHELRGVVLTRLGRDDEGQSALEKSIELDAEHAAGFAGLATLAARKNDLAKAVELFDKAAELAPGASSYPYSAAQLTLASGNRDDAETRLREVVRKHPNHAGARNDLAWLLAEQGKDLDWALQLAEEALRIETKPDFLDTLGWVRFQRTEYSGAAAVLDQAVEQRPDSPSIRYRLGLALSRAGDTERARDEFETALEAGSFPEAEDARRELAQLTE